MGPSMYAAKISRRPRTITILASIAFFFIATWWARHLSWRDPGSVFFDPSIAYKQIYSKARLVQAEDYLTIAATVPFLRDNSSHPEAPHLCVGVASVARNGPRYLRTTVASLLEGLTRDERDRIHVIVFLADTDPSLHPALHDPWLANLADQLLVYNISEERLQRFKQAELLARPFNEKMLFDYMYLMKACHNTGAPYIALFEDDIVAMDGWFHRTERGLREAERKTAAVRAPGDCKSESFRIRSMDKIADDPLSLLPAIILRRNVSRLEFRGASGAYHLVHRSYCACRDFAACSTLTLAAFQALHYESDHLDRLLCLPSVPCCTLFRKWQGDDTAYTAGSEQNEQLWLLRARTDLSSAQGRKFDQLVR